MTDRNVLNNALRILWAYSDIQTHGTVPKPDYGPVWLEIHAANYSGYMLEKFNTLEEAVQEMRDRDLSSNTYYPLWGEGFHADIYGVNPITTPGIDEDGDAYPLAELYPVWNEETNEDIWTLSEC